MFIMSFIYFITDLISFATGTLRLWYSIYQLTVLLVRPIFFFPFCFILRAGIVVLSREMSRDLPCLCVTL